MLNILGSIVDQLILIEEYIYSILCFTNYCIQFSKSYVVGSRDAEAFTILMVWK